MDDILAQKDKDVHSVTLQSWPACVTSLVSIGFKSQKRALLDRSLQGKLRTKEIVWHARRCVRKRVLAARGCCGPQEWVLTEVLAEAA